MRKEKLWVYSILPIIILNLGMIFAIVTYFALTATQPILVAGFSLGQLSFGLSIFICIVEWTFASLLIIQIHWACVSNLIAPRTSLWKFRWLPALTVFVALNVIFAGYVVFVAWSNGSWYHIEGLAAWQKIVMLILIPLSAGFCEELIWRGYIFTQLGARGYGLAKVIILSAISFALLHGVWLPDKLLTTFLFGIVAGFYYARERNLVPLIIAHIVMDVWSFGLSVFF
jgi:membrane protease YdiL (CAAX protease family)